MLMPETYHVPSHRRPVDADSPSLARCDCVGVIFCPQHHAHMYPKYEAAHRGESAEVAA